MTSPFRICHRISAYLPPKRVLTEGEIEGDIEDEIEGEIEAEIDGEIEAEMEGEIEGG